MAEPSPALGRGEQTAALDLPLQQSQPESSNVISEFVSGAWDGAVANKAKGVAQLFGAKVSTPEVKRSAAAQVAHTAGEVAGDLADFVIMSKFAGKAFAKFAPEIAATGKIGEFAALNPVGRNMAVGGTVGLINGAILTPTKEGESGFNRIGRGLTDMATFATLGGVATKMAPMAEGAGWLGRLKVNAASGAAAGVVNSEVDGIMHGRQVGLGEMAVNTLGWTAGNVAFGEGLHQIGKVGAKYFPQAKINEINLGNLSNMTAEDAARVRAQLQGMKADIARSKSTGATVETTNGAQRQGVEPADVAEVRGEGDANGERKAPFVSIVEEGADVDPANPRRITPEVMADAGDGRVVQPIETTRREDSLPALRVAVTPEANGKGTGDAVVEKTGESVEGETTNTRRVEIEKKAKTEDGEVAEAKDKVKGSVMLEKGETVSMRELFEKDPEKAEKILDEYMAKLQKTFPLEGEIETADVYREYLTKKGGTWDMVVLRDKDRNIMGGIQYQIIDVNGKQIAKAAWGEHIWLDEQARNGKNFYSLLGIARENIIKNGGEIVFMEFNNPDKMSIEQMLMDEAAGLSAKDREKIWGRTGIHVLVDSKGKVLEYGQPAMSEEDPPVLFLSLGFISTKPLGGTTLPKEDYLKLLQAAHRTIPSVNVETDPTVKWYTDAVNATGENKFTFVPLNALAIAREAGQKAAQEAMQKLTAGYIAKLRASGELKEAFARMLADNSATPQALEDLVVRSVWDQMIGAAKKGK